jgi:hypothetical protein
MRLQARRLEVRGCWRGIEDQNRVGIDFMTGLWKHARLDVGVSLGDSECT